MSWEKWGVILTWGQVSSLAKRLALLDRGRTKLCIVPCHSYHIYTGAQPEIFQGRGVLVKLGHFYKHFVKNTRKKGPTGKNLGVFSSRYSQRWTQLGHFFTKPGHFFLIFKIGQGRPNLHSPLSWASVIGLGGAKRWRNVVNSLFGVGSHYLLLLFSNFIVNLLGTVKAFVRYLFNYITSVLHVLYLLRYGKLGAFKSMYYL